MIFSKKFLNFAALKLWNVDDEISYWLQFTHCLMKRKFELTFFLSDHSLPEDETIETSTFISNPRRDKGSIGKPTQRPACKQLHPGQRPPLPPTAGRATTAAAPGAASTTSTQSTAGTSKSAATKQPAPKKLLIWRLWCRGLKYCQMNLARSTQLTAL